MSRGVISLGTSDTLVAALSGAVATTQPQYRTSWVDAATDSPGGGYGSLNSTTEVTLIASPSSGVRQVDTVGVYNGDTAPVTVTLSVANGASRYKVGVFLLSSGQHADLLEPVAAYGAGVYQPLDSDLTALAGLSTTGALQRTGSGTATAGTLPVTYGGTGTATQFTAGSVVFAGVNGVYAQDNAGLFWDDTNDRLGVGTVSPATKLQVKDDAAAVVTTTSGSKSIRFGSYSVDWNYNTSLGAPYLLGTLDAQPLYIQTSGITRLGIGAEGYVSIPGQLIAPAINGGSAANDDITIQGTSDSTRTSSYVLLQPNGGNVGIGTASPDTKLTVSTGVAKATNQDNGINVTTGDVVGSGVDARFKIKKDATNSRVEIFGYDNGTGYIPIAIPGGNVGIGTTGPATPLHVYRSFNGIQNQLTLENTSGAVGSQGNGIFFKGYQGSLALISSYGDPQNSAGGGLQFQTYSDNTTANVGMVINRLGNVGLGTTAPHTRLDIDAGAIEFAEMTAPAAGGSDTARLFCRDNGSGKSQLCVIFATGAIQVLATEP